jgi:hypothetical protein
MLATDYLGYASFDEATISKWPKWAPRHVVECDRCAGMVAVDRLLTVIGRPASPGPAPAQTRGGNGKQERPAAQLAPNGEDAK